VGHGGSVNVQILQRNLSTLLNAKNEFIQKMRVLQPKYGAS